MVILSYGESMNQIKGILFDSGDTLVRPKARSWFPKQHFIDPLEARGIRDARMDRFDEALVLGLRYLDDNHYLAADEKIERSRFRTAYRLILEALGIESPSERLISDILRPFDEEVGIEPFPDTLPTLTELRRPLQDISSRTSARISSNTSSKTLPMSNSNPSSVGDLSVSSSL